MYRCQLFLKLIYKFIAIPNQIPTELFSELDRLILTLMGNGQGQGRAKMKNRGWRFPKKI